MRSRFNPRSAKWKVLLAILVFTIIGTSLYWFGDLIENLKREQKKQIKLWANAIQKKADLIKYTNELFTFITFEERKKAEIWARANKELAKAVPNTDVSFFLDIISKNTSIPVIILSDSGNLVAYRNVKKSIIANPSLMNKKIQEMSLVHKPIDVYTNLGNGKLIHQILFYDSDIIFNELKNVLNSLLKNFIEDIVVNFSSMPVVYTNPYQNQVIATGNVDLEEYSSKEELLKDFISYNPPIPIRVGKGRINYILYKDNPIIFKIRYYPIIFILIIATLFLLMYYWLKILRKLNENRVWVGMTKETAHQLGTPISGLMAWNELIKAKSNMTLEAVEIEKDIQRLEMITDRFSKIGSATKLSKKSIGEALSETVDYLLPRTPKLTNITLKHSECIEAMINYTLFTWAIENIIKNAIDAMKGKGNITISYYKSSKYGCIKITDDGVGMSKKIKKQIFEPGFSSKSRGWGLGLSLVKRIIKEYHKGKIKVVSAPEKGSSFILFLRLS